MDLIITDFFSKYEDTYYIDLIEEANRVLNNFNLDISDEITNIILNQKDNTDQDVIDTIVETIQEICIQTLSSHGIFLILDNDILLNTLLKIVDGVYLLQNYYNTNEIINILDLEDINDNERLAKILEIVIPFSENILIQYIEKVDSNLFKSLKTLYKNNEVEQSNIDNFFLSIVEKYKKIKTKYEKEMYGDRFILNNSSIGLDFEIYFNDYLSYFKTLTEEISISQMAYDLISICVLSNKKDNVIITLNKYAYKVIEDNALFSIKINNKIKKILTELQI